MDIAVIGGGLAGLSISLELRKHEKDFCLFEKAEQLGGKLKSINWDGYRTDLGSQVLLSAYPKFQKFLQDPAFDEMIPAYFDAGALLLKDGNSYILGDPLTEPKDLFPTIFCPLLTFEDKMKVFNFKQSLAKLSFKEVLEKPEWQRTTAIEFLEKKGFSEQFINNFARPFFGGVFSDDRLLVRASNLAFCFKSFSEGKVFLPAKGAGEIAQMVQQSLPPKAVSLNSSVTEIQQVKENGDEKIRISLADGQSKLFDYVVLATELETTAEILGVEIEEIDRVGYCNLYFTSKDSFYEGKRIFLNCNQNKVINNGTQLSNLSNNYTPLGVGHHFLSTTIVNPENYDLNLLPKQCEEELRELFPHVKSPIKFIKQHYINGRHSLIKQDAATFKKIKESVAKIRKKLPDNVLLAGEYLTEACSQETVVESTEEALATILSAQPSKVAA